MHYIPWSSSQPMRQHVIQRKELLNTIKRSIGTNQKNSFTKVEIYWNGTLPILPSSASSYRPVQKHTQTLSHCHPILTNPYHALKVLTDEYASLQNATSALGSDWCTWIFCGVHVNITCCHAYHSCTSSCWCLLCRCSVQMCLKQNHNNIRVNLSASMCGACVFIGLILFFLISVLVGLL